jgi:tyrosyl-tRNA synthetase
VDLSRRELGKQVYGMTFALLTNSEGNKMGKTQKGALWLDKEKTSPYEFFQYWRNVEDADVAKCLRMLTFLPMEEVEKLSSLPDAEINKAKEILAFEVTKLVHGEEEAQKALDGAKAAFGGGGDLENIPTTKLDATLFAGAGLGIVNLIREIGLVPSNAEGFRTIQQGGLLVKGEKVTDAKMMVVAKDFEEGKLLIQKGKKIFHMVEL